jgi:hypothetical protein
MTAARLDEQLPHQLRREFPGTRWDPALSSVRSSDPGQLVTSDGDRLRVQLLDSEGDHHDYARWPVEDTPVRLRYRDLPDSVPLRTPTLAAFAAMKTAAWADRHAARDLYDLAALARAGALTGEAADLVKGATGVRVTRDLFGSVAVTHWTEQLAHQTRVLPAAEECLDQVRHAYANALDWPSAYNPAE